MKRAAGRWPFVFPKPFYLEETTVYLVFKRPKGQLSLQNGVAVVLGQLQKMAAIG
jgi:hypothetical protein